MMEKYAVDLSAIPPTDDQIRSINKLAGLLDKDVEMVKTASDAEGLIKELEKEACEKYD